jgi:hypothetical protein
MNNYFFEYYQNETKQNIEKNFDEMTQLEKSIGEFFIKNKTKRDFSSKGISGLLYVSEASLHRFAKKCGYKGYREFIFSYEKDIENEKNVSESEKKVNHLIHKLKSAYTTLVEENFSLINDNRIRKISTLLNSGKRVVLLGTKEDGAVLYNYMPKFLKLGIDISIVTEDESILPAVSALNEGGIVIIFDIYGQNENMKEAAKTAKLRKLTSVLISSNEKCDYISLCNEVNLISVHKGIEGIISVNTALLIIMDIIYSYCLANNDYFKAIKKQKNR